MVSACVALRLFLRFCLIGCLGLRVRMLGGLAVEEFRSGGLETSG